MKMLMLVLGLANMGFGQGATAGAISGVGERIHEENVKNEAAQLAANQAMAKFYEDRANRAETPEDKIALMQIAAQWLQLGGNKPKPAMIAETQAREAALKAGAIARAQAKVPVVAGEQQKAEPEEHPTSIGWVSAERYKNMSRTSKQIYLTGYLDGHLNADLFGGNAKRIKVLRDCLGTKTITQITAIVDKYVESHPEGWDQPATDQASEALSQTVCPDVLSRPLVFEP